MLETTGVIFLVYKVVRVYGWTKIYKFDRNQPNSFKATIG